MWEFFRQVFSSPAQAFMLVLEIALLLVILWRTGFNYTKEGGVAFGKGGEKKFNEIKLEMKKILFYSNAPPIVRLQAGLEYVSGGGNGPVKEDVRSEAKNYPVEYAAVRRLNPGLALRGGT